jgi:Zn-dependent M32 family carboxypeptidase
MKTFFFFTAFASLVLVSCGNNETAKARPRTLTDSLFKEVMDGHDVGMAKMRKLTQAQQQTQVIIDSISKLPAKAKQAAAPYLAQLDSLKKKLEYAEFAMNKWMDEINIDSANDDTQKRVKYLTEERDKVNKVKEVILSSLAKADSLLKK